MCAELTVLKTTFQSTAFREKQVGLLLAQLFVGDNNQVYKLETRLLFATTFCLSALVFCIQSAKATANKF
jgi:hypothetical protein